MASWLDALHSVLLQPEIVASRDDFRLSEPKRRIPRNNVLFEGRPGAGGRFRPHLSTRRRAVELGAFIAFMGVNAASFTHHFLRGRKTLGNFLPPLLGLGICFYIWLNLRWPAKLAGAIWLAVGVIYGAIRTRGFRSELVRFEMPPE